MKWRSEYSHPLMLKRDNTIDFVPNSEVIDLKHIAKENSNEHDQQLKEMIFVGNSFQD